MGACCLHSLQRGKSLYLLPWQLVVLSESHSGQQDCVLRNNEVELPESSVRLCRAVSTRQWFDFKLISLACSIPLR